MNIALCTLVLNEIEWLPKLYSQHRNWPGLSKWIFVEAADKAYAEINPNMVSSEGLSIDGTTEFLNEISRKDSNVIHVKHGFTGHADVAQGKCAARQRYLDRLERVQPDFFVVLDADEFYCFQDQSKVNYLLSTSKGNAFIFKHRDIWRPKSLSSSPLFQYEVKGGFWDIPYCRCWRWQSGLKYSSNHNTPEIGGEGLDRYLKRFDTRPDTPAFIHMGFACNPTIREAKNRYYVHRGEGKTDHRQWYVDSRACFETWTPGAALPNGARVVPYTGPIPECFQS